MWMTISALLAVVCILLIRHLLSVKKQLRGISRELDKTAAPGYNRLVRVELLDKDVTELAAAINRCIDNQKRLKHDAERAEKNLRQSVSDIAHDLRTPLSVIKGDLQLIKMEDGLSPKCSEYLRVCLEKTDTLKEMSDEFFELAVLESDREFAALSKVNVTNLLMSFIADNEGLIRLSGLEPEIIFPPKTVFAMANEQLLVRMLGNLLGNVIKYSGESFRIILSDDDGCRISFENRLKVGDHPDSEHMFERSYRADKARGSNGAGLGLYIVKLLAQKQNASVSAEIKGNMLSITINFKQ